MKLTNPKRIGKNTQHSRRARPRPAMRSPLPFITPAGVKFTFIGESPLEEVLAHDRRGPLIFRKPPPLAREHSNRGRISGSIIWRAPSGELAVLEETGGGTWWLRPDNGAGPLLVLEDENARFTQFRAVPSPHGRMLIVPKRVGAPLRLVWPPPPDPPAYVPYEEDAEDDDP